MIVIDMVKILLLITSGNVVESLKEAYETVLGDYAQL